MEVLRFDFNGSSGEFKRTPESGDRKEISLGYRCRLEPTPGAVNGEVYDAIQRDIVINIKPQKISLSLSEELKQLNVNHSISISGVGVTLDGKVAKGEFIDVVHGRAWLQVRMQERLFRLFKLNDKIPFTNKGLVLVRSEIQAQLADGVDR